MAKNDNLTDFLKDVADAIRAKKGTTAKINPQDFSSEIASIEGGGGGDTPSRPKWTGHADAEGLRAIGWTDEDIAYYQEHGVNWNEEADEYHKVTDDNKALYGVLTADNIQTYRNRIVYLPKIDTSGVTSMYQMFHNCNSLVAIPFLDTSNVTNMNNMFYNCHSLTSIPQLNTSEVTTMNNMFNYCYSLTSIPQLNTSNVTDMANMFSSCLSLTSIPQLNTSNVTTMNNIFYKNYSITTIPHLDTSNVTNMNGMFYGCYSLVSIPPLDTSKVTDMTNMFRGDYAIVSVAQLDMGSVETATTMFSGCDSLTHVNLKNAKLSYQLSNLVLLSKESLLYLINNEAATSVITIKLASYAYTRLVNDADVVAALANHPNISISR